MKTRYEGNEKYIFVSYSHVDKAKVEIIVDNLAINNYRVWFDDALSAGDRWDETIEKHLLDCAYFVFFISSSFVASEYCKKELDIALSAKKTIIPFVLGDFDVSSSEIYQKISHIQYERINNNEQIKNIRSVRKSLEKNCHDAIDINDDMFFETNYKQLFFKKEAERVDGGHTDYKIVMFSIDNNNTREELLSCFDTPKEVDINISFLSVNQINNGVSDSDIVTLNAQVEFISTSANSDDVIVTLLTFAIIGVQGQNTKARLLDVKILSPITAKYEPNKTLADLENETGEGGKKILSFLQKSVIPRSKENDDGLNCLEKEIKKTELVSVKFIFANGAQGEQVFVIPDYQRGYAWEDDEQFFALWEDILRVYYRGGARKHYTGMLSLQVLSSKEKEDEGLDDRTNAFYVVDGQQRLTSMVIILKSLLEYIKDETGEDLAGNLLESQNAHLHRFVYSVFRGDGSREFFEDRIYNCRDNVTCLSKYQKNIDNAKRMIDEELLSLSGEQAKDILDLVLNNFLFSVYFVDTDKSDDSKGSFDVRVTFETMNNRGKPLSNLELLKNRMLYLTTFLSKEVTGTSNYESELNRLINRAWKKIYINLAYEDYQLSDDEFLRAHWIVYDTLDKKKRDTYIDKILDKKFAIDKGAFYEFIDDKKYQEAFDYLKKYIVSLGEFSSYWRLVNNPFANNSYVTVTDDEKRWLDALNRVADKYYAKVALMVIAGINTRIISVHRKVSFYQKFERYIFINTALGYSKNDYSSFVTLASDLLNASDNKKAAAFTEIEKACDFKNEKEAVKEAIISLGSRIRYVDDEKESFYYGWGGIRYFLYEYDLELTAFSSDKKISWARVIKDDRSIEHIMPQKLEREYWTIVTSNLNNQPINKIKNFIGNLLLLSDSENSELSNYSYPTKRNYDFNINERKRRYSYRNGTNAAREVAGMYDYWAPQYIYERGINLIRFILTRWINKGHPNLFEDVEFIDLFNANGLIIDRPNDLTNEEKQALDALDTSGEIGNAQPSTNYIIEEMKKEIMTYFRNKKYRIYFGDKMSYSLNRFKFNLSVNGDVKCGVRFEDDKDYQFKYVRSTNLITIKSREDGEGFEIDDDINTFSDDVKYFIETFNRYLRRNGFAMANVFVHQLEPIEIKRNELSRRMIELLRSEAANKGFELLTEENRYIRFASLKIRNVVGLHGGVNGSWRNINDLIAFEISNHQTESVIITLYIGPSHNKDVRVKWFNFAQNTAKTNNLFVVKKTMNDKWDPITNKEKLSEASTNYSDDELFYSTALNNLKSYLDNILPLIEDAFEKAPSNDNDPIYHSTEN